jgi:ferredoxin
MGHIVNPDKDYELLQRQLDRMVTGAPSSPTFMQILHILFTPEEANLARRMPLKLAKLSSLARKLDMPEPALAEAVTRMAEKGLVLDFEFHEKRYVMLAPVVIGFFEYTFMRTRDELPMAELAKLFESYMIEEGDLAHSIFQQQTQIGRSLVREEALPEGDFTEILDWERASWLIENATDTAVSLCACRHHHTHLGDACDRPLRTCLTLNLGVQPLVRAGIAERISKNEAMSILADCKEKGLAQTGDNVQRGVTYICNCCGDCCGMMQGMKRFNIRNAIVSSNWLMKVDTDACKMCGKCAKACPAEAIGITMVERDGKKYKKPELNEDLCLGCGVCYGACKHGAINMVPREKRIMTPETLFDKSIIMAMERGKLGNLLFDDPEKMSHRALSRMISIIEKMPPVKAALAIEPLKSVFLKQLVKGARSATGKAAKSI